MSDYKDCPHCKGATKCRCGTCGVKLVRKEPKAHGIEEWVEIKEGICKVCGGTGKVSAK